MGLKYKLNIERGNLVVDIWKAITTNRKEMFFFSNIIFLFLKRNIRMHV